MKLTLAVAVAALSLCVSVPAARADVGGEVPAPGLCEYPGVGGSGMIMNAYYYWCDFPTEINGSHWHAELAGGVVQAAITAGVSMMVTFTGQISGNVGGIVGTTSWRCPDNTLAAPPNPPGAWKNYIAPVKCKSIGPAPPPPGAELPPPPVLPVPPLAATGPAVTNPDNPNPLATENPPK